MTPDYPIFILTLEGDEARRAPLLAQLDEMGFDYELFLGVDGRKGLSPEWEAMVDRPGTLRKEWRTLTDGEYACALSHQEIYRTILARDLPGGIVLEDDAVLQPGFESFIRDRHYRRHAMILLDHLRGGHMPFAPTELMPGLRAYRIAMPPLLTTGYTIGSRAARTIRRRSLPLRGKADWPCNIARLDCVALLPRLVCPPADPDANSHLAKDRTHNWVSQPRRLWDYFSADGWHRRIARRISRPFDLP